MKLICSAPPQTNEKAKQRKKKSGTKRFKGKKKNTLKRRVNLEESPENFDVASVFLVPTNQKLPSDSYEKVMGFECGKNWIALLGTENLR